MVQRDDNEVFNKEDYYKNPGKYKSIFHKKYLPYITALFHCIYWDNHCPKYIKNKHLN
jgi:alpha-aminoadipic semialdehyde synthase